VAGSPPRHHPMTVDIGAGLWVLDRSRPDA